MENRIWGEQVWHVKVDNSGRVLLPAKIREAMDVASGAELIWVRDENGFRLTSFDDQLRDIQAYYKGLAPPDVCLTDELIKQRRRDATRDE